MNTNSATSSDEECKIERLQRKLLAARRECQQLRASLDQPPELGRLRHGGRQAQFIVWLLKFCFTVKDVLTCLLRKTWLLRTVDPQEWGIHFHPYQIRSQSPAGRRCYHVFHFL